MTEDTEKICTADTEKICTADIRKIERRIKYIHRYPGMVRERNVCPNCNSLDVSKRTTTKDYICYNCKWTGKGINKIMT